ncbi:MAG: RDD family protein [Planctomycetes bacterium]|nr:RDD family protein [Planctomycetota bacterium]
MSVVDGDDSNPYRAPETSSAVRGEPRSRRHLAGRVERLLASILDSLLYIPAFLWLGLGNAAAFLTDNETAVPDDRGAIGLSLFLLSALFVFAVQMFLLATRGWTLGKRVLKLRIESVHGGSVGFMQLVVLRTLLPAAFGFCCGLFSLIDALFIFGEERRCLHDLLAGTVVVNA